MGHPILGLALVIVMLGCSTESSYKGSEADTGIPQEDVQAQDLGRDSMDQGEDVTSTDMATQDAPAPDVADDAPGDVADVDAGDAEDADPDMEDGGAGDAEQDTRPDTLSVRISAPEEGVVIPVATPIEFVGYATDTQRPATELVVRWSSDLAGELWTGTPEEDGRVSFITDALTAGYHNVRMEVTGPDEQQASVSRRIGICRQATPDTFDTELNSDRWRIYGDAFWDPGGWLEMTGPQMGRKGAIFNIEDVVSPGDVSIRFRIWTGGGTGADGFAMSVFNAADVDELDRVVAEAASGGGLGYGVGGAWGDWEIDGFHVEFDTWHNVFNGNNELHTDPTRENHIGVMTDGDPGTHHLWAEIPTIEDQQWHEVTIVVEGERVLVTLDGEAIIDGTVDGFQFKGGFIGFSGTTGYYTNYHRFDDLEILQECLVP